ncbi:hypothetical protein ACQ86N_27830 [Puia sp. P3]|uniref:hypothetical protein n=1 Tax=Puia sp. P3 TaxID=3423952 RepID=UPI003D668956
MKRFIAVVKRTPGITDDIVAPYASQESERFKQLFESGLIYQYYKQLDAGNFWLIIHSPSQEEALTQLQTFPYFGLGYISINLTELDENKFTR